MISKHEIGMNFAKDQVEDIADYVLRMKQSDEMQRRYSRNALEASREYTMANAESYAKMIAIGGRRMIIVGDIASPNSQCSAI